MLSELKYEYCNLHSKILARNSVICDCKDREKLKVIASWDIYNTAALNVYYAGNEYVIVGVNNIKPIVVSIDSYKDENWNKECKDNEYKLGIKFGNSHWFLDECMKVW